MKARIKFTKTGSMKFIGHLDIMRYFQKAFRRADIDIAYSQGFNRHQLMSFAQPLGVGLTSDGEYLDVELNTSDSDEEMIARLNAQMNDEIRVVKFHLLADNGRNAMSIVSAADYEIALKDGYTPIENFEEKFATFIAQDKIEVEKKTKKSSAMIDIKPFIYQYAFHKESFGELVGRNYQHSVAQEFEVQQKVYVQLVAGSVTNIKPDLVMTAFYQYIGQDLYEFAYQYHRFDLYADGDKAGEFISLGDLEQ